MQTLSESCNILIVEDNPSDLFLLESMLESSRFRVEQIYSASRIHEAKAVLKEKEIRLVLLDLSLPDSFGLESLKEITEMVPRIPVIILTGLADSDLALEALKQNAQDYLVKGQFNADLLTKSIEYSIERKKVEEKILLSEDKYRQMFYKNPFPMWINDMDSLQILEVNDAAIHKYGYSREEFLELSLEDIQVQSIQSAGLPGEGASEQLWKHRKKNGEFMTVEFSSHPIPYYGGMAMQAQVNDITDKISLEQELLQKKQQLVEAVLNAQENERKSIGRELHDNINQILTAVKLNLSMSLEHQGLQQVLVQKSIANVSTVIDEIRKLSKELILPGNLKELGLVHSIEDLLKDMLQVSNIRWGFEADVPEQIFLSEDLKLSVFRIVQEQLTNILKYAAANAITVRLFIDGDFLSLKITDDGKGFDPKKNRQGIGITNIISRAELYNGTVNIESFPGKGCSMEVQLQIGKNSEARKSFRDTIVLES